MSDHKEGGAPAPEKSKSKPAVCRSCGCEVETDAPKGSEVACPACGYTGTLVPRARLADHA